MVKLQKPTLRQSDEFLRAVRRSRALHEGFVTPPSTAEGYRTYVKSLRRQNRTGFFVMLEDTDELVGVINVSEIVRGAFQSAYLGYYGFLPLAGSGLMKQGMHQVLQHCFGDLMLHRLEANIQPQNARSIALVRGLGFKKEGFSQRYLMVCGRWRDHERWAILADESSPPDSV
jgi:ribosomal-protein-alanine N-acetyltransferase